MTSSQNSDKLQKYLSSIFRTFNTHHWISHLKTHSDVITGWMKHAAFLPTADSLKTFEQYNYASYPNSIIKVCLTDWTLGSF